jgi:hypothetical protein
MGAGRHDPDLAYVEKIGLGRLECPAAEQAVAALVGSASKKNRD